MESTKFKYYYISKNCNKEGVEVLTDEYDEYMYNLTVRYSDKIVGFNVQENENHTYILGISVYNGSLNVCTEVLDDEEMVIEEINSNIDMFLRG